MISKMVITVRKFI